MAQYVNASGVYLLWAEMMSRSRVNNIELLVKKNGLASCFYSLGGAATVAL